VAAGVTMKHWIRDLQINFATATRGQGQIDYVMYHFLRTAGWEWIWECDGYAGDSPNRVPDGNMEDAGTGSWTPLAGASVAKVTTPVRSGEQALQVSSTGAGDGVASSVLTAMQDSTTYRLAIWAANDTGETWDVDVDLGAGYVSIGSIPDNGGVWTLYVFSFTTVVGGTRQVRIVDTLGATGDLYVSDIYVFKGYFEYNEVDAWESGSDGETANPDQFSSPSYLFVGGDVGKVICIWDTQNLGNSGAYRISSVLGGVATLDLRSGSASLVSQTGLSWRMIDLTAAPDNAPGGRTDERGAGFGLQSPHPSGHRLFIRQAQHGPTSPYLDIIGIWGAPGPTDFDFSTGAFYKSGPSSQHDKQSTYVLPTNATNPWTGMHVFITGAETAGTRRLFLMTDDDGSFVTVVVWDQTGGSSTYSHDTFIVGHLGEDLLHTGDQAWGLFARWQYFYNGAYQLGISFDGNAARFSPNGVVIGADGLTKDALLAQLAYGTGSFDVLTQTNAGPNRWSGDEWVHKLIIARDPSGNEGAASERDSDIGVYQGRQNMVNLTTFDSDNYLHFIKGLVWEWSGESVLP